ncbi:hypothetical protein F66182_11373 [Fusarium sp. NRRL 66182]|nr:hypothetical protein F66182_11373 [Fusarium sp. NRRL 66182]
MPTSIHRSSRSIESELPTKKPCNKASPDKNKFDIKETTPPIAKDAGPATPRAQLTTPPERFTTPEDEGGSPSLSQYETPLDRSLRDMSLTPGAPEQCVDFPSGVPGKTETEIFEDICEHLDFEWGPCGNLIDSDLRDAFDKVAAELGPLVTDGSRLWVAMIDIAVLVGGDNLKERVTKALKPGLGGSSSKTDTNSDD